MIGSKIQWCDDTVNPVMGCDGCELWATRAQVIAELKRVVKHVVRTTECVDDKVEEIAKIAGDVPHKDLIATVVHGVLPGTADRKNAIREAKRILRCYAGVLTENRGGKVQGYPDRFHLPTLYPGRMHVASCKCNLRGTERPEKPWLNNQPRLIFVSDMGDALSRSISFESLLEEIIIPAGSKRGERHIWLWLTKRPQRMAEFGNWLIRQGGSWPGNLVAMTSITSSKVIGRIDALRRVPCEARGLSIEPLFGPVNLPLKDIDWTIVGGASGVNAEPFDLAWARSIQNQCHDSGSSFFCKQLGSNPVELGKSLKHRHPHGGDWTEWPADLRERNIPAIFSQLPAQLDAGPSK